MAKIVIDILKMELDKRLPYWLSPAGRHPEKLQAIRDKHHARHMAAKKKRFLGIKAFDPDEPRDEHGKWTDGGGGEASGGSDVSGVQPDGSFHLSAKDKSAIKEMVVSNKPIAEIMKYPALIKANNEKHGLFPTTTMNGYGTKEFMATRQYTDPATGKNIVGVPAAIDWGVEKAKSYAGGPLKYDHEATIFMGMPGAGKSTHVEKLASKIGAAVADTDDIKKIIHGVHGGIGNVHDEATDIASVVYQRLASTGANLLLQQVGGEKNSIQTMTANLRSQGYKVNLVNIEVSKDTAFRRAMLRFINTGRLISSKFYYHIDESPTKSFNDLKISSDYASVVTVNNNPPKGQHVVTEGKDTAIGRILA